MGKKKFQKLIINKSFRDVFLDTQIKLKCNYLKSFITKYNVDNLTH